MDKEVSVDDPLTNKHLNKTMGLNHLKFVAM
jgi:hypothetical protein